MSVKACKISTIFCNDEYICESILANSSLCNTSESNEPILKSGIGNSAT